jgi:AhpC/TSA family
LQQLVVPKGAASGVRPQRGLVTLLPLAARLVAGFSRRIQRNGVNVASISYESREILARFADAHHITYPILSDHDSLIIRKFGILNTNSSARVHFQIPIRIDPYVPAAAQK